MFFKKIKEMQSLVNSRTKALKEAEIKIKNLTNEKEQLKEVRLMEVRNNTKILEQNNKKEELIKKISNLLSSNKYNNEKVILNKIKELVKDYQLKN